ncbi:PhzF family phenazine biosynthesis protein [Rhizobium sp. SL42]|uniref:PhzF family phenazine biosynthesis protein n=1 Tax=Rhizobium sp. SL42 TaxID=2806346 RepID=UPI001F28BAFF|nr:PhzF family phenazine biosynthesis protein [Rhizobium sp. SL42]UJW74591.1 PhzF family phenazine biosynthesis protein [Rhizobium sp. SL42]
MRDIPFVTVDVFTDQRFSGNPLAVITDARGLSGEDMQQIATEFGYSETTFVLPPRDRANSAEVRIFTPVTEIPFAGHPNVGTAFVLAGMGEIFGHALSDQLRFEEKAGLVEISVQRDSSNQVIATTIRAPGPLTIGASIPVEQLAPCIGLTPSDIVTTRHLPTFASVGLKFILIEVSSLQALGGAASRIDAVTALRDAYADQECDCATFLYTWVGEDHVRARVFAPLDNVTEDPATGSASAALGAYLASLNPEPQSRQLLVEQGVEMGRRSLIRLQVNVAGGRFEDVTVSGSSVEVMHGTIRL